MLLARGFKVAVSFFTSPLLTSFKVRVFWFESLEERCACGSKIYVAYYPNGMRSRKKI